jgi:hypothetical protein
MTIPAAIEPTASVKTITQPSGDNPAYHVVQVSPMCMCGSDLIVIYRVVHNDDNLELDCTCRDCRRTFTLQVAPGAYSQRAKEVWED